METVVIMQAPNLSWPSVSPTSNLIALQLIWNTRVYLHTQGDYILLLKLAHQGALTNVVFLMPLSPSRMTLNGTCGSPCAPNLFLTPQDWKEEVLPKKLASGLVPESSSTSFRSTSQVCFFIVLFSINHFIYEDAELSTSCVQDVPGVFRIFLASDINHITMNMAEKRFYTKQQISFRKELKVPHTMRSKALSHEGKCGLPFVNLLVVFSANRLKEETMWLSL